MRSLSSAWSLAIYSSTVHPRVPAGKLPRKTPVVKGPVFGVQSTACIADTELVSSIFYTEPRSLARHRRINGLTFGTFHLCSDRPLIRST